MEQVSDRHFVTLLDDGDVELWLARAGDWQLPLFAKPKVVEGTDQPLYFCTPAVPNLTAHHQVELNKFFAPHRLNVDASFWVLDRTKLPDICSKAPGLTPGYYVMWKGARTVEPENDREATEAELLDPDDNPNQDGERFIEFFMLRSGLFERDVMRLFWREFRRVAMLWLGLERQPLDLGFAKIVPLPYRQNWREIVLARHPKLGPIFNTSSGPQRQALLVFFGIYDSFTNLVLASITSKGTCNWSFNLLVDPKLRLLLSRDEDAIFKSVGPESYAERIFGLFQKNQNYALALLAQYIDQTSSPCGRTDKSADGFGKRIVPHIPKDQIRAVAPVIPKVFAVATNSWQELTGPEPDDTCKVVEVKTTGMPQMSALQSQFEDVRNAGDDHRQLGNGSNGE